MQQLVFSKSIYYRASRAESQEKKFGGFFAGERISIWNYLLEDSAAHLTKHTVAMSAECHSQSKRPRPSSALTPLDGNVLGNENDKLIVDTTELQTKYNMLKGFNTELGKRYDKLKYWYTEFRNKYDRLRERLQTEEVRFFVTSFITVHVSLS